MSGDDALVNCFLIGAPKCGSTTLHAVLERDPQCWVPRHKEPHVFDAERARDTYYETYICSSMEEYRELFSSGLDRRWRIDFTPSYLSNADLTADAIRSYAPSARIVAILRDPIERALSHYFMDVRLGYQTGSFMDAVAEPRYHRQYVANGLYQEGVERFAARFGSSILVVSFESIFSREDAPGLKQVAEFLDLDPTAYTPEVLAENRINSFGIPRAPWLMTTVRKTEAVWTLLPRRIRQFIRPLLLKGGGGPKPDMAEERAWLKRRFDPDVARLREMEDGRFAAVVADWKNF